MTTQWPLKRAAHLTSLVWVCVLWLHWKLNGAICAMRQGQGHCQAQTRWSHLRPRVRSMCLLFISWYRTIFGWDIANSILTLRIQGQGHDQNWPKSYQVIYRSGPAIVEKWQKSKKLFKSYRVNKNLRLSAAAYEPVQKYKVTSGIPGWLN